MQFTMENNIPDDVDSSDISLILRLTSTIPIVLMVSTYKFEVDG